MKLKISEAKRFQLHSQGLTTLAPFGYGKDAAVKAIQRIGYVQIDTISVVQRAHHHIFWSRVPDYQMSWLHDMQAVDKTIFEYWSHAAAFLPMESFRYCLPRMERYRKGEKHWWERDPKTIKFVFNEIKKRGPLLARDFENTTGRKAGPWFDRTPAKKALEYLFHEGRLVIGERKGFQKVYELAERYLPADLDQTMPSEKEFIRHLIETTLHANGLATSREIAYLRKGLQPKVLKELLKMEKEGLIRELGVQDAKETYYSLKDFILPSQSKEKVAHILSPFDNLVIQRARLKKFFDFDYQIECYVPEPKRKFGYFVLPVLVGEDFIGRIDAKADRATKDFIIKSFYIEPNFKKKTSEFAQELKTTLERFVKFNGCETLNLDALTLQQRKLLKL